ncbi:hypothetical protein [Streptococcus suis]|uniref:Methionyl-tRNA synthetase n=1 Tax=Streptococcus suis TaxID=1307 RepID=A0A0Z8KVW3_STRSU|nr:methionyl-tRNA synthetase [Streptococcus suis]
MKTNNVEIIKADSLVRRRGVNVERHLKRVAAYCRVSSDSDDQKHTKISSEEIFDGRKYSLLFLYDKVEVSC